MKRQMPRMSASRDLPYCARRRAAVAIQQLSAHFGVTAYGPNRYGHLVISFSEAARLRTFATYPADPAWTSGATFTGIPIEIVPDWTCDPTTLAAARLRAHVARPFVRLLRRVAELRGEE